ncbi:MAG: hypothetical protein ACON4O_05275 [Lentimonas sp.]
MALADPTHERTIDTTADKQIVWEYRETKPNISLFISTDTRGSGVEVRTVVGVHPNRTKPLGRIHFDCSTGEVAPCKIL